VAVVLQPEDLEQAVDLLRERAARNAAQLADEREVLGPREIRIQMRAL
jgi:hypothetical protein